MQRVTITLDDDLVSEIDAFMLSRGYNSRSEALRDLARAGLNDLATPADPARTCVGAVVYSFDHEKRELARRLAAVHHHHHDLSLATTHVHLDDSNCLEVTLLKGSVGEVRHFAEHLTAERGVRYGKLVMVPIDLQGDAAPEPPHAHDPHD